MTTYGTSHFVSFAAAVRYYQDYHYPNTRATVQAKIDAGEIAIGRPALKPSQTCYVNREEGRYFIQEKELTQ